MFNAKIVNKTMVRFPIEGGGSVELTAVLAAYRPELADCPSIGSPGFHVLVGAGKPDWVLACGEKLSWSRALGFFPYLTRDEYAH